MENSLKILQIGMTDNLGGIETYLMNYYRNIDRTKIQFDFINIYNNELCFSDEIKKLGGTIYKVSTYYKHPIKYIKQVIKIINDNSYEIIHCNMNSAVMLFPLVAAKMSNAKVIISHCHNSSSDKGIIKEILHRINKNFIPFFANSFFTCSNSASRWFFPKKVIKSKKYYVINNAIDIEKFKYNSLIRNNLRNKFNIKNNDIVIGHVGRFNKQKNHKKLLEIFLEALNKDSNFKLVLVGIGPLQDQIKEIVKKNNISDKVLFLGKRDDVNELYQMFDIFALPSLYEGLPLVGIEAQISGCKCIFSDSITKELQICDNVSFINKNDTNLWVKTIMEVKTENRHTIDAKEFDIKYNCKKIVDTYLNLLKSECKNNGKQKNIF